MTTDATELLGVRGLAQDMNEHATINFWTRDHAEHSDYHVNRIHKSFKELAALLGYEVTKINPQETALKPLADLGQEYDAEVTE